MARRLFIIFTLALASLHACAADRLQVVVPPFEKTVEPQVTYFYRLLQLVLTKTEATDGPFEIKFAPEFVSVDRVIADLKNENNINLIWTTINAKRERELLPIKISLIGELNNYRVLLIRAEDQPKFDKVKNLNDLRKFTAGLGSQWPDAEVMRNNDLSVIGSPAYLPLFKMLAAKRFDYFPRGLYEVWNEAKIHADLGLVIEKNIMLYYEAPFYFFVNKNNPQLADRIERGLKIAIADGSFEELFASIPSFKRGLEEQKNPQRRLLILESRYNPQEK
jgi:ABC-type amino acid transport substrate-binding protein